MSIYTVNGSPVKYDNKWLANGGTPSSELPPYDSSDAGKALVVNNEGDNVEWQVVGSSGTVDQHYDSTSSNAQSGTAVAEAIADKQDTISDLSDIRSGAEAGATAVQPSDLATVATTGDYADLLNKPTIPAAVTVDQHYSASSTNPQSGTAVAEALQTVPDELPSITGNANKVLKVNSGATGVEWATESAGATYTPGNGINISNTNVISADTTVLATQYDLAGKQDTLVAGTNITIVGNVISSTGGGGGSGIPGYDDLQFKLSTYEYPKNQSVTYTDDGKGVVCSYTLCGNGTSTAPSVDDATIRDKMCLGDGDDGWWFRLATQAGAYNGYGQAFTCSRAMGAAGLRPILFKVSDPTVYYTFPNTVVPTWDGCATNPDGYQCGFVGTVMDATTHQEAAGWKTVGQGMPYPAYSYWEILVHLPQSDMLDANGYQASVNLGYLLQGLFYGTYALGFYQPGTTGTFPNGCDGASWIRGVGSFADNASTYQIQPNLLQNKYAYLPELNGRAGQTISTKSNSSDLQWVDLPQVDDQYSAFSLNAQSGFAVAEAISGVRQVPASTSADATKVLTVNAQGTAEWATASGGGSITVDQVYDATSANAQSGTAVAGAVSGKQDALSSAQLNAANSGITSNKVTGYDTHVADTDIHVTTSDKSTWNAKQDAISDLNTIRSGASAGATAVQPSSLATVATTGSYTDLIDKPSIPAAVTVDQVYDSSSANPQSGVAVASAVSGKQDALSTAQLNAANSGVTAAKVTGYDSHVADTTIHVTSADKTAWSGKQDALSTAQLNAANSGVTAAKVTGYDSHVADTTIHVTSADKTAWSAKQDALTDITDVQVVASLPASPVATVLYLIPES